MTKAEGARTHGGDAAPGTCRACGHRRRRYHRGDRCAACGFDAAPDTLILEGWDATNLGLTSTMLAWSGPVLGAVLLDQSWASVSLGGFMSAHLAHKSVGGPPPARLVVSRSGVGLLRRRRTRSVRWHLFDQARVDLLDGGRGGGSRPRWKLTLVNAYKPSISTYLHRRGTDAAIFAPCVEFAFRATPAEAEVLQRELSARIDAARRGYRALGLAEMDLAPLDVDALLRLARCPACDAELPARAVASRCASCGERHHPGAFLVHEAVLAPPWLGPLLALLGLLAAPALLAAGALPAAAAAVGLAAGGTAVSLRPRRRPRVLVLADGLIIRDGHGPDRHLPFADLRELRIARLETGRRRLAAWRTPRARIHYSSLLFCWATLPPGRPEIDLLIRGEPRVAELLCSEIERRWAAATGARELGDPAT